MPAEWRDFRKQTLVHFCLHYNCDVVWIRFKWSGHVRSCFFGSIANWILIPATNRVNVILSDPSNTSPICSLRCFYTILIKHRCQNNRLLSTRLHSLLHSLAQSLSLLSSPFTKLSMADSQGHFCPRGALRGSWLHHAERIVPRYYSFPAWGVFLLWELINWANLIRKSERAAAETAHTVRALIQRYSSIYLKSLTLQTVLRVL